MTSSTPPCPCGSGQTYSLCCQPIHINVKLATTAEQLMRARYSAYCKQLDDFIFRSWHPDTCPPPGLDHSTHWQGLTIVCCEHGAPGDKAGTVEFIARYQDGLQTGELREISRFVFENQQWYYLDGTFPVKTEKVSRNAPCPCGSGKKHKRCCGK
ncbi:MAG: YchJ family protein [Gammaproteobacteria bacterium]|nr:YchJ family protein [Gammaproteobacteria bacterium]